VFKLNPLSAWHVTLKTPFWLAESSFRRAAIGQARIWCLYQSNSQNFFKFYCHFLHPSHRGVFPVPIAFAKKFCAPHATTPVVLPRKFEEKRGKSKSFISEISDSPRFLPFWREKACGKGRLSLAERGSLEGVRERGFKGLGYRVYGLGCRVEG